MASYWIPAYLAGMKPYLNNPNVSGMYGMWDAPDAADVNGPNGPGVPGEGGVDLDSPQGTPVYALADGPIIGIGYWKDQQHGVVTTRINVPGHGSNDIYYQHIIFDPKLKSGQMVKRGQQIGTIGTLGEIEIGFNANWGQPWGINHPAGWVLDPRPYLEALMAQGDPGNGNTDITLGAWCDATLDQLRNSQGISNLLGAQPAQNVKNFFVAWAHVEGGSQTNKCAFNPLNTMQDESGAVQCVGTLPGIKAYPDSQTGTNGTLDALANGNYGALLNALVTNDEANLGFLGHPMAQNVAEDLSVWVAGRRNPIKSAYIFDIMADAGISQASISGVKTVSGIPGAHQDQINQWRGVVIGQGAAPQNQEPAFQNPLAGLTGVNNFFTALQGFFSNPVRLIKIVGGAALVIVGLVLLVRSLMPSVSIGGKS